LASYQKAVMYEIPRLSERNSIQEKVIDMQQILE
jgi:hypothetical protein